MASILSQNIKFLRKREKISQEELAKRLGIKRSNIAAYESKSVEPRLRIVLELARFFDVSVKTLIDTQLAEGLKAPAFESDEHQSEAPITKVEVRGVDEVQTFIDKTIKIRKILEGFKSFYTFKKSNIDLTVGGNEKLVFDIDNFIQLMEHLLAYNETVIKAITNSEEQGRETEH